MYFKVNFEVRSGYGGPFLSIPVCSGAFRSIPVSKRTRINSPKYVGITENYLCFHRVRKASRRSRTGYDVSLFKRIYLFLVARSHAIITPESANFEEKKNLLAVI